MRSPALVVLCVAGLATSMVSTAAAQDVWATPRAQGQAPTAPPTAPAAPGASSASAAQAVSSASYEAMVLAGVRATVLRDFDGAIATLREAGQREPARPEAFCALGDAQLGKEDFAEARAAFGTCERFAQTSQDDRTLAVAMVGQARAFEREGNRREEREIWQRLSLTVGLESARALAKARLTVLDAMLKLDADYETVRLRIAGRKDAVPAP
jgi:tetratricopeptide (TPR) repeat protein